jgi:hypothetical protein
LINEQTPVFVSDRRKRLFKIPCFYIVPFFGLAVAATFLMPNSFFFFLSLMILEGGLALFVWIYLLQRFKRTEFYDDHARVFLKGERDPIDVSYSDLEISLKQTRYTGLWIKMQVKKKDSQQDKIDLQRQQVRHAITSWQVYDEKMPKLDTTLWRWLKTKVAYKEPAA